MKRFLISAVAAASLTAALVPAAHAVTSDFNVSVTLSSQCKATNSGSATLQFGTYIAFQSDPLTAPSSAEVTFNCTRGLAPVSFSFDTFTTTAGSNEGSGDYGVLAGLNYHLTAVGSLVTGGAAASATVGGVGGADEFKVTVGGTMAGGQAGKCAAAGGTAAACDSSPSHARTLTVTY
jgi:hypothetical protein